MVIDISDLINKNVAEKEVNLSFECNDIHDGNEVIEFLKPVDFNIIFTVVGNVINLDGKLHSELKLICSRCLEKFNYTIDIDIHEKISNSISHKDDDDIIFIDNEKLNIMEIVKNNILINLPIKKLCKKECKGLCQHCGTNLNYSTCKCKNDDDIDPRLEKLKELLPDK